MSISVSGYYITCIYLLKQMMYMHNVQEFIRYTVYDAQKLAYKIIQLTYFKCI